jgi:hypothetical protein
VRPAGRSVRPESRSVRPESRSVRPESRSADALRRTSPRCAIAVPGAARPRVVGLDACSPW